MCSFESLNISYHFRQTSNNKIIAAFHPTPFYPNLVEQHTITISQLVTGNYDFSPSKYNLTTFVSTRTHTHKHMYTNTH